MQTRFNNDMVAHVWAQLSQPYGQNANDSFSFSGRELVSYNTTIGWHFGSFVLMSNDSMSSTTGRHINLGARAISCPVIYIDDIFTWGKRYSNWPPKGTDIKKALLAMILAKSQSYHNRKRDTTRQHDAHAIGQILADLLQVCNHFTLKFPAGYETAEQALGMTAATVAKLARAEKREAAKRKKARKEQQAREKAQFEGWLDAEILPNDLYVSCPHSYRSMNQAFLTVHGDTVHTSQGAQAPLDHVIKAFKLYRRVLKTGQAWEKNGERMRMGHFDLDRIESNGDAEAGCHTFKAEELERFYLKWIA